MAAGPAQPVDVALVLAMDCSGSISPEHLALQIEGYAAATESPLLLRAIQAGRFGRIALTFLQWSEVRRAEQVVPWTWVDGREAAAQFAALVRRAAHPMASFTSISGAIDRSMRLLSDPGVVASRRIIDISGDGANNDGRPVTEARDDALAAGVTINGLPIQGNEPGIDAYYRDQVIGGPHCFIVPARDPHDFAGALLRKMLAEVAGRTVGEPSGA